MCKSTHVTSQSLSRMTAVDSSSSPNTNSYNINRTVFSLQLQLYWVGLVLLLQWWVSYIGTQWTRRCHQRTSSWLQARDVDIHFFEILRKWESMRFQAHGHLLHSLKISASSSHWVKITLYKEYIFICCHIRVSSLVTTELNRIKKFDKWHPDAM